MCDGVNQFIFVVDVKNLGFKNFDTSLSEKITRVLDARYCERLAVVFIVNAGIIFRSIWDAIVPFLPEGTAQKVFILGGAKTKQKMLEFIAERDLPNIYGGSDHSFKFEASVSEFSEEWNKYKEEKVDSVSPRKRSNTH
jgi:hypothetical protein